MKEEDFLLKTMKFRSMLKSPTVYPHLPTVLDAMVDERPPIKEVRIVDRTGLHPTMVSRYVKLIRRNAIMQIRFNLAMVGLGTLIVLISSNARHIPKKHWLASITLTWRGALLSYKYPLALGPGFILRELKDKLIWSHAFPYKVDAYIKISNYIDRNRREVYDALRALKRAFELEPVKDAVMLRKREKPKDLFDLFLLALLEANPHLNYKEMSKKLKDRLRMRFPYRRVRTHLLHLLKYDVIKGFAFRSILESPICTALLLQFDSNENFIDFLNHIVLYPYLTMMFVDDQKLMVFLLLFIKVKNLPTTMQLIKELTNAEICEMFTYSIENRVATYTLPFRNYDPISKTWAENPMDLDRWLREIGYSVV